MKGPSLTWAVGGEKRDLGRLTEVPQEADFGGGLYRAWALLRLIFSLTAQVTGAQCQG